ncbi:MerR family DNA-binding transcriptional regulator [Geodermatophilus sp. SYSU D00705]
MDDGALTIGQLADRLGVPVRTVRFWSDEGLVDPPARSAGGYRLHGAAAVARLDLVRTLGGLVDLGHALDLEIVAEGIAQERRRTHLRDGHVGLAQGHLFAAPLGAPTPSCCCSAG